MPRLTNRRGGRQASKRLRGVIRVVRKKKRRKGVRTLSGHTWK